MAQTILQRLDRTVASQIAKRVHELDRRVHSQLCNRRPLHDIQSTRWYALELREIDTLRRISDVIDGLAQMGDE